LYHIDNQLTIECLSLNHISVQTCLRVCLHVKEYYKGTKHDSKEDDIQVGLMSKKIIIKIINIKKFNKV
jgi:hypothetical protein